MTPKTRLAAPLLILATALHLASGGGQTPRAANSTAHSRPKRLVYFTSERRLRLPPKTALFFTPTLSLPFGRGLPVGYDASMTISIPFEIDFDGLGLTSEENPYGLWPKLGSFRKKRDSSAPLSGINWAGGDREMIYQVIEDTLSNMGMNGSACLLRAICEMFQFPLEKHGFFGELLELLFSASRSPHAEKRLPEYTRAERLGRASGDCFEYQTHCPRSLFTNPGQTMWINFDPKEASFYEETISCH
ncbi:uncharacterized protein LOC125036347 [Penaeus chinensis]|uniref:uncharacterized protein LOC125036347 n=1 Tax=Penaeus chinensis TaxID=139456 RepID=UPI001FB58454|nr:uncharacterized protein LOC125036347 [Penaeus chinensis]